MNTLLKRVHLDYEERVKIQKEVNKGFLLIILSIVSIEFLIHLFYYLQEGVLVLKNPHWIYELGVIFIVLLIGMSQIQKVRKDLNDGYKIIQAYPINHKYAHEDRQDRYSPVFMRYVVSADAIKYTLEKEQFDQLEIGDYVILHKTTHREEIIKTEFRKKIDVENF